MADGQPARVSTMASLQSKLILGLLTILPVALVWFVLAFLIDFLSWIGQPVVAGLARGLGWDQQDPDAWVQQPFILTALAVIVALWIIYAVGAIASNVIGKRLIGILDGLINRIPLVKQVYGAGQKLIQALGSRPDGGGQRVVLLPFPNAEMRAIGFVTATFVDETSGETMAAVYMPTSPNPTSGYLEIVPLAKCVPTSLTADQAMNMILSGGATAPPRMEVGMSPPPA